MGSAAPHEKYQFSSDSDSDEEDSYYNMREECKNDRMRLRSDEYYSEGTAEVDNGYIKR